MLHQVHPAPFGDSDLLESIKGRWTTGSAPFRVPQRESDKTKSRAHQSSAVAVRPIDRIGATL